MHISDRKIGGPLRKAEHDVLSADGHPKLGTMEDVQLLEFSSSESRILVTFNVRDFAPILTQLAVDGRRHAGCILVTGYGNNEFAKVIKGLINILECLPEKGSWINKAYWLSKSS